MKLRRIAYIPARSGSKGVPQKNIMPLCGKPLLGWIVQAALGTGLFDRVMVSTDSEEFAHVAESCGAWVPFLRDPQFAKDSTPTIETICSDKERLEGIGEKFDVFCFYACKNSFQPLYYAQVTVFQNKENHYVTSRNILVSDASDPAECRVYGACHQRS